MKEYIDNEIKDVYKELLKIKKRIDNLTNILYPLIGIILGLLISKFV